jgi:nicotinamide mononucleotide (NMN) deamidase PncC
VFVAVAGPRERTSVRKLTLAGDRAQIRSGSVAHALVLLSELLRG